MAVLLRNKTICPMCGRLIEEGEDTSLFPHFILNENDPLYEFSDSACHTACLASHPLGQALALASEANAEHTGPGKRRCAVCGAEILDPDDYLLIGYLGDPTRNGIAEFNFTHLHKSHLAQWRDADRFLGLAKEMLASGRWKGPALLMLVQKIEAAIGHSESEHEPIPGSVDNS